jgi:hypothetical protein
MLTLRYLTQCTAPTSRHHAYTVVIAIRNVDTTLRVYVAAMWPIQSGSNSQAPITIAAAMPPGNRGDQARNDINPPDGMVLGVDD